MSLRHNEQAWRALLSSDEQELIARLQARRERWQALSILVPDECQEKHQDV